MTRVLALLAPSPHEAYAQSLLGFLIWLPSILLIQPGWSPALLAFGPLVLYPMLFDMIDATVWRRVSTFAFLPALGSYALPQGELAGVLALPWLVFALIVGAHAAYAFGVARNRNTFVELVIKGFLLIGACWLVLARLGQQPLGYEHAIVHATAVHFHYAGFVLPILATQFVNAAPNGRRYTILGALLLGVPFVAAGITLSAFGIHWPELLAVCFFVGACVAFAVAQIRHARNALLIVSSLALIVAMSLALTYGCRNYLPTDWLGIPLMLRTHGPIQVFGFALPGVVAWAMINEKARK